MENIWLSLAWKEWQEHKWKIASTVAVLLGLVVCTLLTGLTRSVAESMQIAMYLGGIPLAIFVGLGIAAGEQSRGTLDFLQAQPARMWRIALCKLCAALLSLYVVVLVAALVFFASQAILPNVRTEFGVITPQDLIRTGVLFTTALIVWSAAFGLKRKDEVSAGAVALGAMLGWWIVLFFVEMVLLRGSVSPDTARLRAIGFGSAPLGFFFIKDTAKNDATALVFGWLAFVIVHAALAARFVLEYGQADAREIRSPRVATRDKRLSDFLGQPRRSPLTAIAWKQLRESGPIALAGLAAMLAITGCYCLTEWYFNSFYDDNIPRSAISNAPSVYGQCAIIFGVFVALVAGIGIALHDVGSRLNTFWRSRAIQPDLWFVVKFLTGLAIVMGVIYLPMGLFVLAGGQFNRIMDSQSVMTVPAAQIALYTAAVLVTCLVRQAVYSAILSIALVYIGLFVSELVLRILQYFDFAAIAHDGWWRLTALQTTWALVATSVVCAIVAWLAMRNDWGRASQN
jgi:ABC-type transport system involved in multi-copper enzyme maturation permease subunit